MLRASSVSVSAMTSPTPRPGSPFEKLREVLGPLPPGPATPPSTAPSGPPHAKERVTVRLERSGHGGKSVTRVEGPGLAGADLAALARELAKALGVGVRVEGVELLVQGDQRERLGEALGRRGFADVRRGN